MGKSLEEMCKASFFFYTEGSECLEHTAQRGVAAGTILAFKGHLDEYMNRMGMEGYRLRKCIRF